MKNNDYNGLGGLIELIEGVLTCMGESINVYLNGWINNEFLWNVMFVESLIGIGVMVFEV